MGTSLTTVTTGTPISSVALDNNDEAIEYFINEGSASGDIKHDAAWVRSKHIYRPEFWTGPAPYTRLVSGEVHYRYRPHNGNRRSVHHSEVNTGVTANAAGVYVPVEGMYVTFSVPAKISGTTDPRHRVMVAASWYAHEIGGKGTADETTDHCADFTLFVDGSTVPATSRPLFTASANSSSIQLNCAHQYSVRYPALITTAGAHSIGLRIRMYSRGNIASGVGTHDHWRHVMVWGRQLRLSWFRL